MSPALNIRINSFSFRRGLPEDTSGNGGGHVFDCRCLPNPGLLDEYKQQTGQDEPVIDFFKQHDDVAGFIDDALAVITRSIEAYKRVGYTNLMISFGCTGGQHRSVYCAESISEAVQQLTGLSVTIEHRERLQWP
ncbi:MAG: hypothetical protein JXR25_05115 [Pontiellaceae bacterium]|nr:hypothetical protein [Pontiellaceae bacterium]MBN2784188.1 hypothetical protein [Pontiellaceae bacterium]